jgi:hypothetical protein
MLWYADFLHGEVDSTETKEVDFANVLALIRTTTQKPGNLPACAVQLTRQESFLLKRRASTAPPMTWLDGVFVDLRAYVGDVPPIRKTLKGSGTNIGMRAFAKESVIKEDLKLQVQETHSKIIGPRTCKERLYQLLEDPNSSGAARILSLLMGTMIVCSVITLILEPLVSPKETISKTEKQMWAAFELFFTVAFTVELALCFFSCDAFGTQTRSGFIRDPLRIADFVAILPFYIDVAIDSEQGEFRLFRVARLLRLSRLVRLGRLAKQNETVAPVAMVLVVIWGIYMKNGLKE